MTRIQKINLLLIGLTWLGLIANVVVSQRIIYQQRKTIALAEQAIHNWQVRALACESGGQTVVLK